MKLRSEMALFLTRKYLLVPCGLWIPCHCLLFYFTSITFSAKKKKWVSASFWGAEEIEPKEIARPWWDQAVCSLQQRLQCHSHPSSKLDSPGERLSLLRNKQCPLSAGLVVRLKKSQKKCQKCTSSNNYPVNGGDFVEYSRRKKSFPTTTKTFLCKKVLFWIWRQSQFSNLLDWEVQTDWDTEF